jgi:hypothetical protein
MAEFADAGQAEAALEALAQRESGPLVRRLEREPGKREARYAHLFGAPNAESSLPVTASADSLAGTSPLSAPPADPQADRLAALEAEVRLLREEIERLKQRA